MKIPITCVICSEDIPEDEYPEHMATKHPAGQLSTIAAKKNVPNQDLPPGITPEFLETLREIEKAEATPPPPPKPPVAPPVPSQTPSTPEPIVLTYLWKGTDKNGHTLSTLEMDIDKVHFVVAYCLQEKLQIETRRVPNLHNENELPNLSEGNNNNSISDKNGERQVLLPEMLGNSKEGETDLEQGKTPHRRNKRKNKKSP